MPQSREYLAQAKREQRERQREEGLCILRYKGCAGVARPEKTTCQNCADRTSRTTKRSRKKAKKPT